MEIKRGNQIEYISFKTLNLRGSCGLLRAVLLLEKGEELIFRYTDRKGKERIKCVQCIK